MLLRNCGGSIALGFATVAIVGCTEGSKAHVETKPSAKFDFLKPSLETKTPDVSGLNPKASVALSLKNVPIKLEVNTDWELSVVVGGTVCGIDVDSTTPILKFSAKDFSFTLIPMDAQFCLGVALNKNVKRTYSNGELGYEFGSKFQATRWVMVEFKAGLTTSPKSPLPNTLNFTTSTFENGKLTFAPMQTDWKKSEMTLDPQKMPALGRSPFALDNPSTDLELGKWIADFDAKWSTGQMKLNSPQEVPATRPLGK